MTKWKRWSTINLEKWLEILYSIVPSTKKTDSGYPKERSHMTYVQSNFYPIQHFKLTVRYSIESTVSNDLHRLIIQDISELGNHLNLNIWHIVYQSEESYIVKEVCAKWGSIINDSKNNNNNAEVIYLCISTTNLGLPNIKLVVYQNW